MNFLEMQDLTAGWLDDLQYGYFTTSQVKVWLNNAQKRVQKRLLKAGELYYKLDVQTTLVANQRNYQLPDDFKKLHYLEVVISGTAPNESTSQIVPVTEGQRRREGGGTGTPYCYTISGNQLFLYPAPDTALVMRMGYSYEVADMVNDGDHADVPESYHELLPLLATEDGFLKDGRASELLQKKLKEFSIETSEDAQERNQDLPRGIVEVADDSSYSSYF